jgi:hypothetical protein
MQHTDKADAILRNLRQPSARDCRRALDNIRCILVGDADWSMDTLQMVADVLSATFGGDWFAQTEADLAATKQSQCSVCRASFSPIDGANACDDCAQDFQD